MNTETLTEFFKWCSIINVGLFALAAIFTTAAPDLTYKLQGRFYPLPRETYNVVMYAFLGWYKITVLVFSVTPWIALTIIG